MKNIVVVASFCFLILSPSGLAQNFGPEQTLHSTASGAFSIYATDLDNDGDADVLSASAWDDTLAWYENLGGGVFAPQQVISTTGDYAKSVYATDLNGDSYADVLLASGSDNKIAWYANSGGGSFGTEQVISTTATGAFSVYAADLDNDGDADVLSASPYANMIAWYENDGLGNFGSEQAITTSSSSTRSVYAMDLDGDGDADVLSASYGDDKVVWYENDGNGAFGAEQTITEAADGAYSVYATDIDGDGDADVLSASYQDSKIAWYENDGSGAFGPQQVISLDVDAATSVYAADMDGDGDVDALSASYFDDKIAWYENLGGGTFGQQQAISTTANTARSVYATDLDGDGDADVLSAAATNFSWYENSQYFGPEQVLTTDAADAECVISADLDGDGDPDVISAANLSPLYWFENQGLGVFSAGEVLPAGCGARYLDASDLDQDGDLDILVAEGFCGQIGWIENLTNGTGIATFSPFVQIEAVNWASSVHAVDLDGDATLDVVYTEWNTSSIFWKRGLGTSGGTLDFAAKQLVATIGSPDKVISADLDEDGDLDLVSSEAWGERVAWYENNMNAAGAPWIEHVLASSEMGGGMSGTHSQQAVDIDGDSDLDLLFACYGEQKIVWLENDGAGDFFQDHIVFLDPENFSSPHHHYAGDLDGDGDPDILAGMWGPNRVSYFINDGFGGFSHEKLVSNIVEPRWVYPSDLDEDGQLDVLVATLTPGTISWYPNLYCGHSTSYCEALPNSVSPIGAQIRVNGRSSISTNEMTLRAQNLRPNQFGVFFFGPLTQDPPASFGNGLRCVGTFGLSRLNPPVPTGSGTAQRVLDTTIEPLGTVSAGNTAHFQFWYRDPGTGAGFNLTDALSITFCP